MSHQKNENSEAKEDMKWANQEKEKMQCVLAISNETDKPIRRLNSDESRGGSIVCPITEADRSLIYGHTRLDSQALILPYMASIDINVTLRVI